jgi:hypothetical protein
MKNAKQPFGALDRLDAMMAVAAGLLSLAAYVRTLLPDFLPNDSGEFQTLSYTLDHAHTTGYPVYLLIGKLFTFLPIESVAYRINLYSAVMAGLTVALVYLHGRVLSGSRWAGALAALALAISGTFWSQSIIAEVYTPGSAVTAAVMLWMVLWRIQRAPRYLFLAGLVAGLGIGVHGTITLLAPAVAVLLLISRPGWRTVLRPALGGALVGLALMVASFAVLDARETRASVFQAVYYPSASAWDATQEEIDSFAGRFNFLFTARQWRSAMFADPGTVMPDKLNHFNNTFPQDFAFPMRLLMLVGLVALWVRDWRLGLFLTIAMITHAAYTFNYSIGDIFVFFISLYIYLCVLIAEGAAVGFRLLSRLPNRAGLLIQPAVWLLLVWLAVAPVYESRAAFLQEGEARWDFMGLPSNRELNNWRTLVRYNVRAMETDTIVLMDWYNLYGYFYAAHVEEGRTDLLFLEAYPYSTRPGMPDSLLVYIGDRLDEGRPVYMLQQYDEVQRGGFRYNTRTVGLSNIFFIQRR